ncbi:MAG: low molecular weight phosphotyrosine protein phosphatase [Clostridia bacterium]|nr:low molecular weight phosphotyrosine protein phosphatase [Clostridia bacterium]
MKKILFVCHGNICRSPMAEFVFKKLVDENHLSYKYDCDSRATTREEIGNGIYPAAARELNRRGVKIGEHAASQMTQKDYEEFDLIVGMDSENMWDLMRMTKKDPLKKLRMLMDYTDTPGEVSDPWYTGEFERAYDDIFVGCTGLLEALEKGEE